MNDDDDLGAGPTDTLEAARAHARAQAAAARPVVTIPSRNVGDLPGGVDASDVVWDETVPVGGYAARRLPRDTVVRISDVEGDAAVSLLVFRAEHPAERLNVADTVKVQWQAYLDTGALLLSDMGRVLMTIVDDTSARHDCFCGASTLAINEARYGDGSASGTSPGARELLALAAAKHGLTRRDLPPSIGLFKGVRVSDDGGLDFDGAPASGSFVELRAELDVLVVIANSPHPLDPRSAHAGTPVRCTAWRTLRPAADPFRDTSPERQRAFENTEHLLESGAR
ncbi:MAG TPA: urea amidolyase associated protein UAAP1 [Microthrixaceae bacterium]|nr:urea amidolyase associated protein UAAP1 [Microthrixaceae bacterium]